MYPRVIEHNSLITNPRGLFPNFQALATLRRPAPSASRGLSTVLQLGSPRDAGIAVPKCETHGSRANRIDSGGPRLGSVPCTPA
jgi:hypothetical protein